jgi:hypothetical protein
MNSYFEGNSTLINCTVFQKLMFAQQVKKVPAHLVTFSFFLFTKAHHLTASSSRWIRSVASHRVSLKSILMLSSPVSHPSPPFRFPGYNIVYSSHLPYACYVLRLSHPPLCNRPKIIGDDFELRGSSLGSFSALLLFLPLDTFLLSTLSQTHSICVLSLGRDTRLSSAL